MTCRNLKVILTVLLLLSLSSCDMIGSGDKEEDRFNDDDYIWDGWTVVVNSYQNQ